MPHIDQRKRPRPAALAVITLVTVLLGTLTYYEYNQHLASQSLPREEDQNISVDSPIGQSRPGFTLPDMIGKQHNINEWNNKLLVINFWAAWCVPCRHEIPVFTQLQAKYKQAGLQFIGVAIDEKAAVTNFISELKIPINYPMLIGEDEDKSINIAKLYGNEYGVLPYSVIVDRSGKIAYIQYGEFTRSEIEHKINSLL